MPLKPSQGMVVLLVTLSSGVALADPPTKAQCIAANEAVQYLREAHKLREAREKLLLCVSESCPGPIRDDCTQRLDEVEKVTPSIVFVVKDAAGNDVEGVTTSVDGQSVAASAGTPIQVDPGDHTFAFEAQGSKVEKKFVIVEGVKERREVIRLSRVPSPEPAASAPTQSPSKDEGLPVRPGGGPPLLSWVAFGVGGAGLILGISAGLVANGAHSTLQSECGSTTCPQSASGDLDSFHTWRTISTVGYVVGALGAAGGAVWWLMAPKASSSTTAKVWLGPSSVGVAGRF